MAANNVSTTPFFRCDVDKSVCAITLFFGRLVSSAGFAYRFFSLVVYLCICLFVCFWYIFVYLFLRLFIDFCIKSFICLFSCLSSN